MVIAEILDEEGKRHKAQLEIDFVCNQGSRRYYIQSAYKMDSDEKMKQEQMSLKCVDDSFKKIVIVNDDIIVRRNNDGIVTIELRQFLLDNNALEL